MGDQQSNPWKFATIGMALVFATALITGVVVANYVGNEKANPVPAQGGEPAPNAASLESQAPPPRVVPPTPRQAVARREAPAPHPVARPSADAVDACNRYASAAGQNKTTETVTDALIGGAVGAGLGAASGAIAGSAGKGAGVGGLVGVAAGTLYGLNQANQKDARAVAAYRACMRRRGYTD
jgi:hypothetical protein